MPLDTWDGLQKEIDRMNGDAAYRPLRPLIDQLQPIVGAKVDMNVANGLLSVIESLHNGELHPSTVLEQPVTVQGGKSAVNQSKWRVDTVNQTVNQLVFNGLPQVRAADSVIPVPIVLVVMTATEAAALASCEAFTKQPDALRQDFEVLRADLQAQLHDWTTQYGMRPEDWRPFGQAETIEARAVAALDEFTETLGLEKRLVPRFIDIRTLQNSRALILRLRRDGCIVVLDTISLRHPGLLAAFQRTLLDAYPSTSVVTIMPHQKLQDLTRGLIYSLQLPMSESELSKRRIDAGEFGVCVEVTAMDEFPPWLQTRVKQICSKAITERGIHGEMKA